MEYKFNLRLQLIFGGLGFACALGIIYLLLNRIDFITAFSVGLANFVIAGFYTDYYCRKK